MEALKCMWCCCKEAPMEATQGSVESEQLATISREYEQMKSDLTLTRRIYSAFDAKGAMYERLGYSAGMPSGFPEQWFSEFRCHSATEVADAILEAATEAFNEDKARILRSDEIKKKLDAAAAAATAVVEKPKTL